MKIIMNKSDNRTVISGNLLSKHKLPIDKVYILKRFPEIIINFKCIIYKKS